jgi:hypothetical protein
LEKSSSKVPGASIPINHRKKPQSNPIQKNQIIPIEKALEKKSG